MELFNQIGKKASEAYKITADKTGKMAKETKMKLKMSELKSQINEIYKEIGKRVYENHLREDDENSQKEIEEKCIKIDVLSDEIDSLLKQCLELRDKKQCEQCHTEIEKDAKFCYNCGAKQEEPKKEEGSEKADEEKTDLEVTVEVESDNKKEVPNTEQENANLENTIEVEANPSDNMEITNEEVMTIGADEENEVEAKDVETEIKEENN